MPSYHIELRTASKVWDTLDVERDDLTALRIEMARFVGQMLADHAEQIWEDQDWRIDVTDDEGLILYVLEVSATNTAATMTLKR
jgi:hypothetical protein